ncbi:MAG: YesL family protein [Lachnospiraceae bacterium]|nr:YesL family protein [Lachnospiraceae bacterium]
MDQLWNLDNGFFRFMSKFFDIIILGVLALVCSIGIITIGPSLSAMYYVMLKLVRNEEGYVVKGFFKSFRQNFKQGVLLELLAVAVIAFLTVDLTVTYQWMNEPGASFLITILFYLLLGFMFVAIATTIYAFPILARFENPTKKIVMLSLTLAQRNLPQTLLQLVIYVLAGVMIYIYPISMFFVIGIAAFINSIILRKIFDPYVKTDSEGKITEYTDESVEALLAKKQDEIRTGSAPAKITYTGNTYVAPVTEEDHADDSEEDDATDNTEDHNKDTAEVKE